KIFLEPLMALWPWPLRQIIGNRLRCLADRPKSFPGVCAHEAENLRNAGLIHARGNINEHKRGEHVCTLVAFGLALRKQRGDTTKRGTDRDRLGAPAAGGGGGGGRCV